MADIPEDDLEETRAALAPTLEATAAILPWLAKPRKLRFDAKLNERWVSACEHLDKTWSARRRADGSQLRPAIFTLYGIALESADTDCLRLGEALATAADVLEEMEPPPRLVAALSATIESLHEASGLEHTLFGERARHFAQRLEACLAPDSRGNQRSSVLDSLFASEAMERLELMREALLALPPDAYALKLEATELAAQAEHLELYGVLHLCRHLQEAIACGAQIKDLDAAETRDGVQAILQQLEAAIAAINA